MPGLPGGAPFLLSIRNLCVPGQGMQACIHAFTFIHWHLLYKGTRIKGWAKQTILAFRSFQSSGGDPILITPINVRF